MTLVYCNENNVYASQWLRNLFPDADVDDRSIVDVGSADVSCYDRVHLFAGIGGWEYALQLAGWPDSDPVWTGSCPCQPFSVAGKKKGSADERHLWPEMYRLIRECTPSIVFGEQVAGVSGLRWFDGVRTDLEKINYACGLAVLPASSTGSPHRRDRIFWVADAEGTPRIGAVGRCDARVDHGVIGKEWGDYRPYECRDGKVRRVGTGVQPLAARVPGDVEQLQAWGNSIVPQVAALFITAYMLARGI